MHFEPLLHRLSVLWSGKLVGLLLRQAPGFRARRIANHWRDMGWLRLADVAFVSFPKSGRTFVRVMLARLYQRQFGIDERELLKFSTLARSPRAVPRLLFTHNGNAMRMPHEIRIDREAFGTCKVILLARHPGDIAVSRYFHCKHRSADPARRRLAQQPLDQFIWTRQGGIPSIVAYLNGWADFSKEKKDIKFVRYEDILAEPEAKLAELAAFIGLGSDDEEIAEAVEFARFDKLKETERQGYFTSKRLGAGHDGHDASYKVRAGGSGGFRALLGEEEQRAVQSYVEEHLHPMFGYADERSERQAAHR